MLGQDAILVVLALHFHEAQRHAVHQERDVGSETTFPISIGQLGNHREVIISGIFEVDEAVALYARVQASEESAAQVVARKLEFQLVHKVMGPWSTSTGLPLMRSSRCAKQLEEDVRVSVVIDAWSITLDGTIAIPDARGMNNRRKLYVFVFWPAHNFTAFPANPSSQII